MIRLFHLLTAWAAGLAFLTPGLALGADCKDLLRAAIPGAAVISAAISEAGPLSSVATVHDGPDLALPRFCRVIGTAAGSSIHFEVWLPAEGWNGRFLSVGNGGFGGKQPFSALADGLSKGFAVTGNDAGHQGDGRDWMSDRSKVRFWGHSATHLVTLPAKTLTAAYYGRSARYAYFEGCSTGGAQAMEEAQFYPADYDGVVAGAPGMSYAHLMLSFLWGLKATEPPGAVLTLAKLKVLARAVLQACDGLDGLRDGLISDPLACRFDPGSLTCTGGETNTCLTPAEIITARLIYQGPRNARTGAQLHPGFAFGSEADPSSSEEGPYAYGWNAIQGPLAEIFAIPLMQDMVFRNKAWDWRSFDWDKDVADLDRRVSDDITALNPDLSAFAAHGGKLLMYQGWGDPLNAQTLPIDYRRAVIARFSARDEPRSAEAQVDRFFKIFMVPGMGHCKGGPGPNQFDALTAMTAWVESGTPPLRLAAFKADASGTPVERPLCAFPAHAQLQSGAEPGRADSFVCTLQTSRADAPTSSTVGR